MNTAPETILNYVLLIAVCAFVAAVGINYWLARRREDRSESSTK